MRLGVSLQPFALVFLLLANPASAQGPVAIVEEIDSKSAGVEFMDYLTAGKTIALASADRLVIGYLKSCWREKIALMRLWTATHRALAAFYIGAELLYIGPADRTHLHARL